MENSPGDLQETNNDSENLARRGFFRYMAAGAALATLASSTAEADPVCCETNQGLVNVKDHGALGNGIDDDSPAFQDAVDYSETEGMGGIYIPPGTYRLATPVEVGGFTSIAGVGGIDYGGQQGSILKPVSTAFTTSAPQQQLQGFFCQNLVIIGGTIAIDLGLRHNCIFRDLVFIDPATCAISLVRGERIEFTNVSVYSQSVSSQYGFALAAKDVTDVPGLAQLDYGSAGPWVDRITANNILFFHGPAAYVETAIHCGNLLSHFNVHGILCQGIQKHALYVEGRLQHSNITDLILDQCQSPTSLVKIGESKSNVFSEVSPGASGNNTYAAGIEVNFSTNSTFINCNAGGDNNNNYGFKFGNGVGQAITLLGCRGSLKHDSVSALQQNRITQVNCTWTASSASGSAALSALDNRDIVLQLMADSNGAAQSSGSIQFYAAKGGGSNRKLFDASLDEIVVGRGKFDDVPVKFGDVYEWYDNDGNKRAKRGVRPQAHDDGTIISANPI